MKRTRLYWALCLAAVPTIWETHGQTNFYRPAPWLAKVWPTVDKVEAGSVDSPAPVENRLMHVYFTVKNNTAAVHSGFVAATVSAGNDVPKTSDFWDVVDLQAGGSAQGAVTVTTPRAGQRRNVQIFYFESVTPGTPPSPGPHLGETSTSFNSAARFVFALPYFRVGTQRARLKDTDYASMSVLVGENAVMMPRTIKIGDVGLGVHPFQGELVGSSGTRLEKFETDPFELVPGVSPDVSVAYSIINLGAEVESTMLTFFNKISDATAGVLSVFYKSDDGWDGANAFTKYLNEKKFAGCDGPVVIHEMRDNSAALESKTASQDLSGTEHFGGDDYRSQAGCGRTSSYSVAWTLRRVREGTDDLKIFPVKARVRPNGKVRFRAEPADVDWDVKSGGGRIDPTGLYQAPSDVSGNIFVVVEAREKTGRFGGKQRKAHAFISPMPEIIVR
jgi:hypothetical protein